MKQVSRCPPLRYGAEFSSLAMSGLAFSVAPVIRHSDNDKEKTVQQHAVLWMVTGQLADKPTRGQSSRGLDNSLTSQAEMFDLKVGVNNSSKCYLGQITLFIRCQCSIGSELGIGLCLMYTVQVKYSNSMIFKNSLSAS